MRVAVFDLDGTITRYDTFVPYLRGWLRRHPHAGSPGKSLVAVLRYLASGRDRGLLKSDLLRACMPDATTEAVQDWTAEYVGGLGDAEFCPGALSAIERHRATGDRLVLLSASVDLYVPAIGTRLGFAETICSEVAWRAGRLDGTLTTPNRRGDEKRRCIERLREQSPGVRIAAYGNSGADFPHLTAVEEPMLVNAGLRLRRAARRLGMRTAEWRGQA